MTIRNSLRMINEVLRGISTYPAMQNILRHTNVLLDFSRLAHKFYVYITESLAAISISLSFPKPEGKYNVMLTNEDYTN